MRSLEEILRQSRSIAIVGLSSDPARPSFGIAQALQKIGYQIIPVNPKEKEVLGQTAYPSLLDIPGPVDLVNVFRRPNQTPEVARQAVQIRAQALWLQLGIENEEAAQIASAAGLDVVMDRCIMVEYRKLGL
ncbi:MAG: CoA-binding protein [Acidobacteriota bacterium]